MDPPRSATPRLYFHPQHSPSPTSCPAGSRNHRTVTLNIDSAISGANWLRRRRGSRTAEIEKGGQKVRGEKRLLHETTLAPGTMTFSRDFCHSSTAISVCLGSRGCLSWGCFDAPQPHPPYPFHPLHIDFLRVWRVHLPSLTVASCLPTTAYHRGPPLPVRLSPLQLAAINPYSRLTAYSRVARADLRFLLIPATVGLCDR